jgi:polyisoprenoid-binding protein YceI
MSTPLTTPQTGTSTWKIDPVHSVAEFKVRHMMISNVKGQFTVTGSMMLDLNDITKSRIEASADAASVNTRDPAQWAPEESRLLRRGEVPGADFRIKPR